MRIAFFTRKKRRTQTPMHVAQSLEQLGHSVKIIQYGRWKDRLGRRLADAILFRITRAFGPDLILTWKDCISAPLLSRLGERWKTAVLCVDWFAELPAALHERARIADLFLVTNPEQLAAFKAGGIRRPVFWPQGFHAESYEPSGEQPADASSDVAFIGKPGPPHRRELLKRLDGEFDLAIWGPGWEGLEGEYRGIRHREVLPGQYQSVCRASKVMVGRDAAREVELCFSNRLWLTLGCGGFLVTNYVPGFETLFENHKHLVWYTSPDECVELVRDYVGRPDDRRRIAEAGRELIRAEHTYLERARRLVELVESLPAK